MARLRTANPAAPTDEDVATMSIWARFVWAYLPCHADLDGRLLDKPFSLKLDLLPMDDVDMNAILGELAARRHIVRYVVDGRGYIQIRSFHKHQRPHKNEKSRGFPGPAVGICATDSGKHPNGTEQNPCETLMDPGSGLLDPGSGEVSPPRAIPAAPPLTGPGIAQLFGKIRAEEYGGLDWQGAGAVKPENTARAADLINATVGGAATVAESLRRFWRTVKTGDHPATQEIAAKGLPFAFGCWLGQYPTDHEDITGVAPPKPPTRASIRATGPPRDIRVGTMRAEENVHLKSGVQE